MAGEPFKVGRFAHSLRVRLMREHIGIDVDALDGEEVQAHHDADGGHEANIWDPDAEQGRGHGSILETAHHAGRAKNVIRDAGDVVRQGDISVLDLDHLLTMKDCVVIHGTEDVRAKGVAEGLNKIGLKGLPGVRMADATFKEVNSSSPSDGRDTSSPADPLVPILEGYVMMEHELSAKGTHGMSLEKNVEKGEQERARSTLVEGNGQRIGAHVDAALASEAYDRSGHARTEKTDANAKEQKLPPRGRTLPRNSLNPKSHSPWTLPTPKPQFDADSFEDPICDEFWNDIWVACAAHNVGIFRVEVATN